MDGARGDIMRASYDSLFRTAPDTEIFVIDNGGSLSDSQWLLDMTDKGHISSYIRNRKNMHFWYGRNQGLKFATGDYIVICDNDIVFEPGWVDECVSFLESHPGKYLASPIKSDPMNSVRKIRWVGELDGWRLNSRAGSNVFMMRRSDFEIIGDFDASPISGSKYVDRYNRMGYVMALMPHPKAQDIGLRRGYNLNTPLEHFEL